MLKKLIDGQDAARIAQLTQALPGGAVSFAAPHTDRAAWGRLPGDVREWALARARELLGREEVVITDEVALRYATMGDRQMSDGLHVQANERIRIFALAAAIEGGGPYVAAYEKAVRSKCGWKTWVGTAHDKNMDNYYGRDVTIDLVSSCCAWELAMADRMLGDLVSPQTRQLVRENLSRRIFEPYEAMLAGEKEPAWWFFTTNNWNAVCVGAVLGTALAALEDPARQALYAAAWERWVRNFEAGFPEDGYCTEGPAYWCYGFSHYFYANELLREASRGLIDRLRDEKMQRVAQFCLRMTLPGGAYPAIADCTIGFIPEARPMNAVCARLGLPKFGECVQCGRLYADALFWFDRLAGAERLAAAAPDPDLSRRSWFESVGVLLCRPGTGLEDRLAACLKGGNNREHHNHNDVGSFTVSKDGVQLVSDIGHEYYTADTFSDKRYDRPFYSSYGHSVPRPADTLQGPAKDSDQEGAYAGKILQTDFTPGEDRYKLDLTEVYPAGTVRSLTRAFVYTRGEEARLTVEDEAAFDAPQFFEEALLTYGTCEVRGQDVEITLQGQRLTVSVECGAALAVTTEQLQGDIKYAEGSRYAGLLPTRIAWRLREPAASCRVKMTLR